MAYGSRVIKTENVARNYENKEFRTCMHQWAMEREALIPPV